MKKRYQTPESGSKFLRTSIICGSTLAPNQSTHEGQSEYPGDTPGNEGGDARRRGSSNLLDV